MKPSNNFLDSSTVQFVKFFARAYPGRTTAMVCLLIVAGLAEGVGLVTLLPLLEFATGQNEQPRSDVTNTVVDALTSVGITPALGTLLLLIVVAFILKSSSRWLAMKQVGYAVAQVATDLRLRLIRAILNARWSFFATTPTGNFANALSSEAERAANAYRMACKVFADCIQVLVYIAVVVTISWEVAVIALLLAPLIMFGLRYFVRMSRQAGAEQTRIMKGLVARLTSILPGIKPVKAMARERYLIPFLEQETQSFNEARQQSVLASESLRAFREPIIILVLSGGLYGAITIGTAPASAILVAAVLFYRVMTTAGNIQSLYQEVTIHESAFWSMMNLTEEAEVAAEPEALIKGSSVPKLESYLAYDSVSFQYNEGPLILDSISLEIKAGEMVALVGASGAGKTTLVDLATGLLRPTAGEVVVDGTPLSEVDINGWRRQLGYVPQSVLLLDDTIYDNVTFGDGSFSREDVESALRDAGAWNFVKSRSDGLDTVLGEGGATLSGGQRQRIALARALIHEPRLLILDEPTSALDPETEADVCRTLVELKGKTTILSISHQPAIQESADRVFELRNGRLSSKSEQKEELVEGR